MSTEFRSVFKIAEILQKHGGEIQGALEVAREEKLEEDDSDGVPPELNRDLLALGEMPLCRAVFEPEVKKLFVPFGYKPKMGSVQVFDKSGRCIIYRHHNFYYDVTDSSIFCITPGQLGYTEETFPKYKGAALDLLQETVPENVLRLNSEILILHGTINELEETLGYRYTPIWD